MNSIRIYRDWLARLLGLLLPLLLAQTAVGAGRVEDTFPLLKTRTGTYTNVTVTKKTKDWIFIVHSRGMVNVKITDLPLEVRQQLGYTASPPKNSTPGASTSGSPTFADNDLVPVSASKAPWGGFWPTGVPPITPSRSLVLAMLAALILFYLFFCYCNKLICTKAGTDPGFLIWLPVLQLLPMLRAAGMSNLWFPAFLLPGLNLLAQIVWSINIVNARDKNRWLALWLVLPFTGPFAFLYLAFSGTAATEARLRPERPPEPMVLDAS